MKIFSSMKMLSDMPNMLLILNEKKIKEDACK
jgi:hypothetical protein